MRSYGGYHKLHSRAGSCPPPWQPSSTETQPWPTRDSSAHRRQAEKEDGQAPLGEMTTSLTTSKATIKQESANAFWQLYTPSYGFVEKEKSPAFPAN